MIQKEDDMNEEMVVASDGSSAGELTEEQVRINLKRLRRHKAAFFCLNSLPELHVTCGAALQNGALAWAALERAGLLPPETTTNRWPPDCGVGDRFSNVGGVPYHLAAVLRYVHVIWCELDALMPKEDDSDG